MFHNFLFVRLFSLCVCVCVCVFQFSVSICVPFRFLLFSLCGPLKRLHSLDGKFLFFSFFMLLTIGLVYWPGFGDPFLSANHRGFIISISFLASFSHKCKPVVFHWSVRESKSSLVSSIIIIVYLLESFSQKC